MLIGPDEVVSGILDINGCLIVCDVINIEEEIKDKGICGSYSIVEFQIKLVISWSFLLSSLYKIIRSRSPIEPTWIIV